jgi:hypothetical protein
VVLIVRHASQTMPSRQLISTAKTSADSRHDVRL